MSCWQRFRDIMKGTRRQGVLRGGGETRRVTDLVGPRFLADQTQLDPLIYPVVMVRQVSSGLSPWGALMR